MLVGERAHNLAAPTVRLVRDLELVMCCGVL